MFYNLVKKSRLLLSQNWNCITPNGVHHTHLPILFTIVITRLHTFWKKSNRSVMLQIPCRIGSLPISLKRQVLVLHLFMEDSGCSPFKVFQNQHFMLISL